MAINQNDPRWQRFPPNVLEPSAPYIYFLSLLESDIGKIILQEVSPYFNNKINKEMTNNNTIDAAFDFLDTVINSEYNKERNFLEYLKNKTRTLSNFTTPSIDSDWNQFVKEIQEQVGAGENKIQAMENELKRLQHQNERRGNRANVTKKEGYDLDQVTKLTTYVESLTKFISKSNIDINSISNQIYSLVLSKYGNKLIEISKNGELNFNKGQFLGLLNTITTTILHDYIIKTSLDDQGIYLQYNKKFDINQFKESINSSTIESQIDSLLNRAEALPFISQDLAESFGYLKENDEKIQDTELDKLSNIIQQVNINGSRVLEIGQVFQDMYKDFSVPETAFKMVANGNAFAEISSLVNFALSGAFSTSNTGATGAKPDNVLGFLTIDIEELLGLKKNNRQAYDAAIKELNIIHGALKTLSNEMRSTNTDKYYKIQQWKWNKAVKEIEGALQQLKEIYGILDNCYIIEDSTKNYISLYGKTINHQLNDSLHGGSLGPNITDQIIKINGLATIGGISFPDAKWLISAIINSGPNMIGQDNKHMLEDYLAAFATILLFDDQINIVKDAYKEMITQLPVNGTVTKIHLFSLNDGYYPLSFVLKMTRDALTKNYIEAQKFIKNTPSGGAKVEISGYVTEPQEAYKKKKAENQWLATRDTALDNTKLSIQFLVGFMGVLDRLFPTIQ